MQRCKRKKYAASSQKSEVISRASVQMEKDRVVKNMPRRDAITGVDVATFITCVWREGAARPGDDGRKVPRGWAGGGDGGRLGVVRGRGELREREEGWGRRGRKAGDAERGRRKRIGEQS